MIAFAANDLSASLEAAITKVSARYCIAQLLAPIL